MDAEQWVRLLEAAAALSWIAIAVIVAGYLSPVLNRMRSAPSFTIRVGQLELSANQLGTNIERIMDDLCRRITELEKITDSPFVGIPHAEKHGPVADILWVESEPESNAFVISALKGHGGFDITLARTTKEALDKIKYTQYKAVVTSMVRIEDGSLHDAAGLALIKKLKQSEFTGVIIVYCGRESAEKRGKEAKELGAELVTYLPGDAARYLIRKFHN